MINLAMLLATGSPANAGTTNIATVNPNLVLVENFEGWGTSLCWWANVVGGYANRSTYASLAFTSLKLNIVRYNIGGGENPGISNTMSYRAQMPGFEPTNGVWNWNADANQRWMLSQAVAMGANRVVAFANSPPWWMTVSGSVTGNSGLLPSNNLKIGYETNFASYLATVVSNLTVLDGIHFDFVTPMNEPSGWWKLGRAQEGCNMSVVQQARVVNDLRSALNSQNIAAGIDASEDYAEQDTINDINGYGSSKSNVTLWLRLYRLWEANINGYGSSKSNVTLITTHTYFADNPGGIHNLSVSLGKPAWVSEYGDGDGTGLTMAQCIHDDITGAQVSAWVYWQVVDSATGWGFLKNPLTTNSSSGFTTNYTINEKFYVMEQFSRYIRPGFQIIGINDTNSLVAYNSTNQTLVIVAVNGSTNNLNVTYNLGSFATLPTRASAVQTSPSENLARIAAIAVTNNSFFTSLVPQSVTTFVLTNVTPAVLAQSAAFPRLRQTFDFDWRYHLGDAPAASAEKFSDSDWREVDVPHDFSREGGFSSNNASCTAFLPGGIGWYRKTFVTPANWRDQLVGIQFDGVSVKSKVWINGHFLGERPYAYSTFNYDLTPYLHFGGTNVIAVRADRSAIDDSRWYPGSGIDRHVWLIVTEKIHLAQNGIYITTPEVAADKALAHVKPDEVEWVEADELWTYVGQKKRPAGCGGRLIVRPRKSAAGRWGIVEPKRPAAWLRRFRAPPTSPSAPTSGIPMA